VATPGPKIPQRGEGEGDVGAAVLALGSLSSTFGDDVALQLTVELQWQWWRGEMTWRGSVIESVVVVDYGGDVVAGVSTWW